MTTARDLLKIKGNQVWTISPYATALETLKRLAEKEVGALIVVDHDEIIGVISERDFARAIAKTGTCILDMEIENYMTRGAITIAPDQSVEECMKVMSKEKIRHLPVVENKKLIGMISIGDIVKEIIANREAIITNLEEYFEGQDGDH